MRKVEANCKNLIPYDKVLTWMGLCLRRGKKQKHQLNTSSSIVSPFCNLENCGGYWPALLRRLKVGRTITSRSEDFSAMYNRACAVLNNRRDRTS